MSTQCSAAPPSCVFDSDKLILQLDVLVASEIEAASRLVDDLMRLLKKACSAPEQEFTVETAVRDALVARPPQIGLGHSLPQRLATHRQPLPRAALARQRRTEVGVASQHFGQNPLPRHWVELPVRFRFDSWPCSSWVTAQSLFFFTRCRSVLRSPLMRLHRVCACCSIMILAITSLCVAGTALGHSQDPVPALLAQLHDPNPATKVEVIHRLVQLHDRRAVEPLIGLLSSDPNAEVRRSAAYALGQLKDPRALQPLIASLKDENPGVCANSIFAVTQVGGNGRVNALIAALAHEDPHVCRAAAVGLVLLGDKNAVLPLIKSLNDNRVTVRSGAAFALGFLGDQRAVPALLRTLGDDRPIVRLTAIGALGLLADPRSVPELRRLALGDPDPRVRARAAEILKKLTTLGPGGQPVAIPGVTLLLYCENSAGPPLRTTTDEIGRYSYANLAPGKCRLAVSAPGFREETKEIEIKAGTTAELNIQITLKTVVQKVEVHGQGATLSPENAAPASKVNNSQLEALPLAEQKFQDALPMIPGVIRTSDGKLNIRGSAEGQEMLEVDSAKTVDPVTGSFSIPIPLDVIQTVNVNETPFGSQYGGFSGGLATIETKPPSDKWNYKLADFNVSFRGKNDHVVGVSQATPRVYFGGPLIAHRLNFSEAFEYDVIRNPVRGLAWPHNEIKKQGFNSFTSFQAFLSPQHLLSAYINVFPLRTQFADINALIPQIASSDYDRKGVSLDLSDLYDFSSGAFLRTGVQYTRFDSNAHGQGLEDMLLTPEAWGGNYFNTWNRTANQFEAFPVFQFAPKTWHGHHEVKIGMDVTYRSYTGVSLSHPVQSLRQDGTLAEQIDFQGNGNLRASSTEAEEFIQDHWLLNDHLALDFGGRLSSQSVGRAAAFAPRVAIAYSPGRNQKTVIRAGAGFFYNRVSLLAADFAGNPTRVVSLFDKTGTIIGTPVVFQNDYVANGSGSIASRIRREPTTDPRSVVANFEVDRQLWRNAMLRLNYTYSQTHDLFVVNPIVDAVGNESILALSNSGNSHYHEFEATLHFQPFERSELNISYVWSRARGDLNTLSDIYIPFEQPVIRPNVSGILASDVPNRLVGWGVFHLPWGLTAGPLVDLHTGFPYSSLDNRQNYAGEANGLRYPTFFSLDLKLYRDFHMPLPFVGNSRSHKIRIGVYSTNITNHGNYNAVFNNIDSPYFGQFAGFERRVNGFLLSVVK